eukprot:188356-Prymnesium_polylepis.1
MRRTARAASLPSTGLIWQPHEPWQTARASARRMACGRLERTAASGLVRVERRARPSCPTSRSHVPRGPECATF